MPDDGAYAFSTVLPYNADVATLIGGSSNVASAFLGPDDEIFGTAILGADFASQSSDAGSTFDFHYQGNLPLGLIEGVGEFNVTVNGVQVLAEDFVDDRVIDLGPNFGPNIDLTIVSYGSGDFVSRRGFLGQFVRTGAGWPRLTQQHGFAQTRLDEPHDGDTCSAWTLSTALPTSSRSH